MRTIKMTRGCGRFEKGETIDVGNKSALYLVEHAYAEYTKGQKNLPKVVKKKVNPRRVDAMTTTDVLGGED